MMLKHFVWAHFEANDRQSMEQGGVEMVIGNFAQLKRERQRKG